MADTAAQEIIALALGTHVTHPKLPMQEVPDLAMEGREGLDVNFEAGPGHAVGPDITVLQPFAKCCQPWQQH